MATQPNITLPAFESAEVKKDEIEHEEITKAVGRMWDVAPIYDLFRHHRSQAQSHRSPDHGKLVAVCRP